jgi:prophage antirepressor-like protein
VNEVQVFNNEEFGTVRTVLINNEPYFVGKDAAAVLGYGNTRDAISKHVDSEDKGVAKCDTLGGIQEFTVINESGLYALIFGSKLPNAKKFKHWVTSEVLPTIRKTGGYHLPQTYKEALQQLLVAVEENERLALENTEMKPKAEFFDAVAGSKDAISMQEVAKALGVKGYGRNNLFEFLRSEKVLDRRNQPYQRYVDMGWFNVIEQHYQRNGEECISIKTLVYQKGVDGIRKMLQKNGESDETD